MSASYKEETLEDGSQRTVLALPPALAPNKIAVLPLVNKDGLPEISQKIVGELKIDFPLQYDAKDAIGKRYRRQDAIGTPYCVTIDHDTKDDQMVTIRERDSMSQERVPISSLHETLDKAVSMRHLLKKL